MKKSTTPPQKNKSFLMRSFIIAIAMLSAVVGPISMVQTASADIYDDRIKALESQIAGYQNQAATLAEQAVTLRQTLDSLTVQKNTIQAQLDLSQAQLDKINEEIALNEKKLAEQQEVLSAVVALMIAEDQVTPIEMLASASSVGDYMMRQDQLTATTSQLKDSIKSVNAVKEELNSQRAKQEQIVKDEENQRNTLAAKEAEQASILAATQNQEAAFQNLISQSNSKISEQRSAQAAANAAAARTYHVANLTSGGSRCGGYPAVWCNAPIDSLVDSWGMYNRECVSYTAWKVASTGRWMPYWGGHGNANQWPASARADGIPTGYTPKVGSVAIMMSGYYGHAMYVEKINSNGTIRVSQFNWGVVGEYSEMDISPSGLIFIYF